MSKINRLPKALQYYFGNTSQGKNPDELSNTVINTVDIAPFYNADQVDFLDYAGNAAAVYAFTFATVPDGEVWMPLSISFDCTAIGVGERFSLAVGVMNDATTIRCAYASEIGVPSTTAVETTTVAYHWNQVELLAPDQSLFGLVNAWDAGGNRSTRLKLRIVRLKA